MSIFLYFKLHPLQDLFKRGIMTDVFPINSQRDFSKKKIILTEKAQVANDVETVKRK